MAFLETIAIHRAGLKEVLGIWVVSNLYWNTHHVFVTLLGTYKKFKGEKKSCQPI